MHKPRIATAHSTYDSRKSSLSTALLTNAFVGVQDHVPKSTRPAVFKENQYSPPTKDVSVKRKKLAAHIHRDEEEDLDDEENGELLYSSDVVPDEETLAILVKEGSYRELLAHYEAVYVRTRNKLGSDHVQSIKVMDHLLKATWDMQAHDKVLRARDNKPIGVSIEFLRKFRNDHPILTPPLSPQCSLSHVMVLQTTSSDQKWSCSTCDLERVGGLCWFCESCSSYRCYDCFSHPPSYSCYQVKDKTVVPNTKSHRCSYVDMFLKRSDEKNDVHGRPYVSTATVYVSHAFETPFLESLDVMEQHASNHPNAYYWFNPLMTDQNQPNGYYPPIDVISRSLIREIGSVLLVLSPWFDPLPFKRSWCLWELMCALNQPNIKIEVTLPANQVKYIKDDLMIDHNCVLNALVRINTKDAEACLKEDRDMVRNAILKHGGFTHLDQTLCELVRPLYLTIVQGLGREAMAGSSKCDERLMYHAGNVLLEFQMNDEALIMFEKSLEVNSRTFDAKQLATSMAAADCYAAIGLVYQNKGDYDKAIECGDRSLEIRLKVLGPDHPDTASSFNNIGLVYNLKGDYEKAFEYFERCLAIRLKIFGTDHEDTATSYNNIGLVYSNNGDYDKASDYFNRSLNIRLKVCPNHPNTAASYSNIGLIDYKKGDYDKGIVNHERSLAIRMKVFGPDHPDTAASYNNLGLIYEKLNKYEQAVEYLQHALVIRMSKLGKDHPGTVDTSRTIDAVQKIIGSGISVPVCPSDPI